MDKSDRGCIFIVGWNEDVANVMLVHSTKQTILCLIEIKDRIHFTWVQSRKNPSSGILKKIDRVLGNIEFMSSFSNSHALFLPHLTSDHSPDVLIIPKVMSKKHKAFRNSKFFLYVLKDRAHRSRIETVRYDGTQVAEKFNGARRVALKIDIQKAYDTVNWDFLEKVQSMFKFPTKMIRWIMICVCAVAFTINVNSDRAGYFKGRKGLRQGDPISPYIFTLVIEVFTLILQKQISEDVKFKYYWGCKDLQISHLCFADDLLVLCHGDLNSVKVVKHEILSILPFKIGSLSVPYLGVPLITKHLTFTDCNSLIDKVKIKDRWWGSEPLTKSISIETIRQDGMDPKMKIKDMISNGQWKWPMEWNTTFSHILPTLSLISLLGQKICFYGRLMKGNAIATQSIDHGKIRGIMEEM
ncbi:RNA-directed DNA polymerase, eukaryota, reverse transcriptase zinc-binding domain protein [Tanacetum coccineum]